MAANANCPAFLSYQSNNIRRQWKQAFTSAKLVRGGAISGIMGPSVSWPVDAPGYHPSILACLLFQALACVLSNSSASNFTAQRREWMLAGSRSSITLASSISFKLECVVWGWCVIKLICLFRGFGAVLFWRRIPCENCFAGLTEILQHFFQL